MKTGLFLIAFLYLYSSVIYCQKNDVKSQTIYIKFDKALNLDDLKDLSKIEGFKKVNSKYPFTIKKGLSLSNEKIDELSSDNHSIRNIFKIETKLNSDKTEQLINELKGLKIVEYCYKTRQKSIKHTPPPPPHDIAPITVSHEIHQGYLESNPGVNMRYAWNLGISGKGINIRVIEYGLNPDHEDLDHTNLSIPAGMTFHPDAIELGYVKHGTMVAGVIYADRGTYGVSGLAHNADNYIIYPEWTVENEWDRVLAITEAIKNSRSGDVIIYEMQTDGQPPNWKWVPAEFDQVIWDLTKIATDNGITIVAAAGNGAENLDNIFYSDYLNRGDSGAIIVGAGSSDLSHIAIDYSTYGSRVDVQGWAQNVFTTGGSTIVNGNLNQSYISSFAGTSSATAVVAGCTAVLQSYYYSLTGGFLTSIELRNVLINTGTAQGAGKHIGPLPNMEAAMNAISQLLEVKDYSLDEFFIGPNPANDYIYITIGDSYSGGITKVMMYNLLGQKVYSEEFSSKSSKIDVQHLNKGIFILKIENSNKQMTKKIIVNR